MNSGTGRILAGCGCLTWLGCVLLLVVWEIVASMGVLPNSLVALGSVVMGGSSCCSFLGFVVGLVGIIMMLVGKKPMDDI